MRYLASKKVGELNPRYNGGLTAEQRYNKRYVPEYRIWRKRVYERDNYRCQCCNKSSNGDLQAHHLFSYTDFADLRFVTSNGITLCLKCHKEFHRVYGRGKNTPQQLKEFFSFRGKILRIPITKDIFREPVIVSSF